MIEIVFFTSSSIKLAHARHLCRDYDVRITGFREKTFGANYIEPRIYDRDQLIEQSYQDALRRWKNAVSDSESGLFFIEDTSVAIEALSGERETPGLDVKYWMAETDFVTLDAQLRLLGNNRRAIVRSDLVLHLPPEFRSPKQKKSYRCFTSCSRGSVIDKEKIFDTNPMYPWLDNKTFNKWFVPDGCDAPISMLSIADADQYDFRASAFREMLVFLEQHKKIVPRSSTVVQKSLLIDVPLFLICGPSCAGKSTLAEYLADNYGYYHIEASDFMYLSYYERHGVSSQVDIGDFAEQALKDQPEIVAEQILGHIQEYQQVPIVVTGFRSPLEVEWFQRYYSGCYSIVVVYVSADAEVRFERSVLRRREDLVNNREKFLHRDAQQAEMGLMELENRFISDRFENNSDLKNFFTRFDKRYIDNNQRDLLQFNVEYSTKSKLEGLILKTLGDKWDTREYFTTTEIAQLLNQSLVGKPKSKNNISRYFNQRFYPYYEIKLIDGIRKYRLSNTGYGKARLLSKK